MLVGRVLGLGALALAAMTPCGRAFAHGTPPTAYAVVSHDDQGALVVRLSTGLAVRRAPDRFQFVCPAAWGDEAAAPAAAFDDGTIVVGATNGLMLLKADGSASAHPDPASAGISTEVLRSAHGVFSLRNGQQGAEVLAIDADKVRVIWKDTKSWYSLAALDDKLLLLRVNSNMIEQVTLSAADGKELDRQVAMASSPVDYAFVRGSGGSAYTLLLFQTAPELGVLRMNSFNTIADGSSSISGPLAVGPKTFMAVDGHLATLTNGMQTPVAEPSYVLCLEENGGLNYACTTDGIARVNEQGLGDRLFKLSWLTAPNLDKLAAGKPHDRCDYQWQDMRFDLIALGIPLLADSDDAGVVAPVAGEPGPSDAAVSDVPTLDAGEGEAHEAGAADAGAGEDAGKAARTSHGCSALPNQRSSGVCFLCALLGAAFVRRRK